MKQANQSIFADFDNDAAQAVLPVWRRRETLLTFLVILIGFAIYLPKLGDYALFDPWEPHYSQVAMEMNDHGDWLTPHYREHTRWFSKPILPLWLFKTSFLLFGVNEFAARLPIVFLAVFGLAMFNFLIGRLYGWRAGGLATLVLAGSPQFFFIARQAIFDMPYVVMQMIAMGFLLVGLFKEEDNPRWVYGFWVFSAFAMMSKGLLAVVVPASVVGAYVLVSWDWAILKRMRFGSGLFIFFAIASPWFIYMTAKFGMAYPKSFFIYHHFERMAGLIKKPNDTFDLYVRQIFFASFPFSAFLPMAIVRFLSFKAEDIQGRSRMNFMTFLAFAMPYIFLTFSSTKFNHYIFPVVPFIAVLVGFYLAKLIKEPEKPFTRFEALLALLIFAILAKDIITNYKHLIHLFVYYYDRALPANVNPRPYLYALFIPMGVAIGFPYFRRKFQAYHLLTLGALALAFSLLCNTWLMPKLADTFSQKALFVAYDKHAKEGEPICEYHSWRRRSVSYYFKNDYTYIDARKSRREKRFFKRPGRLFCMVDRRYYSKLRERVKSATGRNLYVVDSNHPFTYLVSTENEHRRGREKAKMGRKDYLFKKAPPIDNKLNVLFADKIRLVGWEVSKKAYKVGEQIELTLLFEAMEDIDDSYQIFIHGDIEFGGGRLNGDHFPADGHYPTDRWKKGDFIKDVWKARVPETLSTGNMEIYVGLFNKNKRLNVSEGLDDGEDRVKLTSVRIFD